MPLTGGHYRIQCLVSALLGFDTSHTSEVCWYLVSASLIVVRHEENV